MILGSIRRIVRQRLRILRRVGPSSAFGGWHGFCKEFISIIRSSKSRRNTPRRHWFIILFRSFI